jgi:uncharacterized SAM-binding protein YcdF (DUF218 family)
MFYYLSKILWFLAAPSNLLALAVLAGMVLAATRFARFGRRVALLALFLIFACGIGPIGNMLLLPLEERFAQGWSGLPEPPAGIIVLGGGVDDQITSRRGNPLELNEAGDRVLTMLALAKRFPEAKIIFTGGAADVIETTAEPEAEAVKARIAAYGLDPARILFESRSRNTFENALFTRELLKPQPSETYWLVTSAFHMPRSMGVFRHAGFDVRAFPVDYRTGSMADVLRFSATIGEGLRRTDIAVKEWLGLLAYRLTGKTDALWPAP